MSYSSLPDTKSPPTPGKSKFPWTWLSLSVLILVSTGAFHWRWERPISSSPIALPEIPLAFTTHHHLLPFDQATQEAWASIISPRWWDMTWVDGSGQAVVRGLDMFHKLHCLIAVREEFTALALDPDRHRAFQAEDGEAEAARLHLGHCFDFLRQVSLLQTRPPFRSALVLQRSLPRELHVLRTPPWSPSAPATPRKAERGLYTSVGIGVCLCPTRD